MASKIRIWNPYTLEREWSREEYSEMVEDLAWFNERRMESSRAYLHDRTGIVTTDPVAFEKWLENIER